MRGCAPDISACAPDAAQTPLHHAALQFRAHHAAMASNERAWAGGPGQHQTGSKAVAGRLISRLVGPTSPDADSGTGLLAQHAARLRAAATTSSRSARVPPGAPPVHPLCTQPLVFDWQTRKPSSEIKETHEPTNVTGSVNMGSCRHAQQARYDLDCCQDKGLVQGEHALALVQSLAQQDAGYWG